MYDEAGQLSYKEVRSYKYDEFGEIRNDLENGRSEGYSYETV
jgi:hypothetical protein